MDAVLTDVIHYESRKLVYYHGNLTHFVATHPVHTYSLDNHIHTKELTLITYRYIFNYIYMNTYIYTYIHTQEARYDYELAGSTMSFKFPTPERLDGINSTTRLGPHRLTVYNICIHTYTYIHTYSIWDHSMNHMQYVHNCRSVLKIENCTYTYPGRSVPQLTNVSVKGAIHTYIHNMSILHHYI